MSESTYQTILIVLAILPIVGSAIALVLRQLGHTRAAAVVDALTPLAIGAARTAASKAAEPPPKPPPTIITMIVFALVAFGCGPLREVEHVVQVSSEVIAVAEPCLMASYEREQVKCLDLETDSDRRACVDRVRSSYAPVFDGLSAEANVTFCPLVSPALVSWEK